MLYRIDELLAKGWDIFLDNEQFQRDVKNDGIATVLRDEMDEYDVEICISVREDFPKPVFRVQSWLHNCMDEGSDWEDGEYMLKELNTDNYGNSWYVDL